MANNWIQKAIKRPGRLTRACRRRGYKKATCACADEIIATTKNKSLKSAAILGKRLMGCKGVKGVIRRGKGRKKKRRKKK